MTGQTLSKSVSELILSLQTGSVTLKRKYFFSTNVFLSSHPERPLCHGYLLVIYYFVVQYLKVCNNRHTVVVDAR